MLVAKAVEEVEEVEEGRAETSRSWSTECARVGHFTMGKHQDVPVRGNGFAEPSANPARPLDAYLRKHECTV